MVPVNGETDDVFVAAEDSGEREKEGGDCLSGFLPAPAEVSAPPAPASGSPRKEAEPKAVHADGETCQSPRENLYAVPSLSPAPPTAAPETTLQAEATPTQPTAQPTASTERHAKRRIHKPIISQKHNYELRQSYFKCF